MKSILKDDTAIRMISTAAAPPDPDEIQSDEGDDWKQARILRLDKRLG